MKLFFDLDGTLIDVAPRHYRVYEEVVNKFSGTPLTQRDYWQRKRENAKWQTILLASGLAPRLESVFLQLFVEKIEDPTYLEKDLLFAGAKETLARLAEHNICYLVSLRRRPERLKVQVSNLGLHKYFHQILSGHSQYDGSDVKSTLITGALNGERGLIVGDTEADIITAKTLGLIGVAVTSGIRNEKFLAALEPDYILPNISNLTEIDLFAS